jgi:alpha-tubulin suppressor-like RCC1 family protein
MKNRKISKFYNSILFFRLFCLIFFLTVSGFVMLASSTVFAMDGEAAAGTSNLQQGIMSHGDNNNLKAETTRIAAGLYHSLVVKRNGELWAMGYNNDGQLGDGTVTPRSMPGQVIIGATQGSSNSNRTKSQ